MNSAPPPRASHAARKFLAANLAAVATTQPRLAAVVGAAPGDAVPFYARDGSITAFGLGGKWWSNCSVPLRAAEAMLATLDVTGRVACFLGPTLAAHLRVALRRSRPDQAVLAVCPDVADLRVMLACDDFSADVLAHRLWFAWGEHWPAEMKRLFDERPGLATPAQFVRLPNAPAEDIDRMVPAAQTVFAQVNAQRAQQVTTRRDGWRRRAVPRRRLCVIAPSHFRLWHDAGAVLAGQVLSGAGGADAVVRFDPDDPACSSAVALLDACEGCDAIVAADTSRADLPGVVPPAMPWATWVTRPGSLPGFEAAGPADVLVLAEAAWEAHAAAAGWPADRVAVGGWPSLAAGPVAETTPRCLAVVADTRRVAMPEAVCEFSSHALLWDHIAAELAADPFPAAPSPAAYLEKQMKHHGVGSEGFDAAAFVERLIVPAFEQAVARLLTRQGLPVRLFGSGWDEIEGLDGCAAGPVTSQADLASIAERAAAVVDVCPLPDLRPVHRLGRPVVSARAARGKRNLLEGARAALRGSVPAAPTTPAVTTALLLSLL